MRSTVDGSIGFGSDLGLITSGVGTGVGSSVHATHASSSVGASVVTISAYSLSNQKAGSSSTSTLVGKGMFSMATATGAVPR